jgi:hypothetical protein
MPWTEGFSCSSTPQVLDAWLDDETARWAQHLRSCVPCAQAVEAYTRLSACLRRAPEPAPPAGAAEGVLRAVAAAPPAHARVVKWVLAPAVVLCIVAIAWAAWQVQSGGTGALSGGVHWRATRQPIADAWVVLLRGHRVVAVQSTRPLRGGFRLTDLPAGEYGVVPLCVGAVLPEATLTTVHRDGRAMVPLWLDPAPAASHQPVATLHGTVTDRRTGRPVAGPLVVIVQAGAVRAANVADSDGRYTAVVPSDAASDVRVYAAGQAPVGVSVGTPSAGGFARTDVRLGGR